MIENLPQEYVDATQAPQQEIVEEAPVEQVIDAAPAETPAPVVEQPKRESDQEYNIRRIREEREQYQRERDELAYRLAQYEKAAKQAAPAQQQEEEPLPILGESDLVEGKHLSRYNKDVKALKQELKQYQKQMQELAQEAQIRRECPDFDAIVNSANIDEFKRRNPKLAEGIGKIDGTYNQATAVYEAIKSLGIATREKNTAERQAIAANSTKPRVSAAATSAYGDTPLSHANDFANGDLTDEMKEANYREMMRLSQGY